MLTCDGCGQTREDVRLGMYNLCLGCEGGLRADHAQYAKAQANHMSRDAGCPVQEKK